MEVLQSLGVKLIPVTMPENNIDASGFGPESAAFFDELIRTGGDKKMANPPRAAGFRTSRLLPAVEFLQAQRTRMMMMMQLAESTAGVDIYLVPANGGGGAPAGGRGRGAAGTPATPGSDAAAPPAARGGAGAGGGNGPRRNSVIQRHFAMANSAGYPALNIPNGFAESGSPRAITFYARPFMDGELLALGKAYQDVAGFHLKKPNLTA
jgi:Asp-tRNA(Asn)/Glu-tRNA(Gln) amidotransferase A subunit family amidase